VCDDNYNYDGQNQKPCRWSTETGNQGPGGNDGSTGEGDAVSRGKQSEGETRGPLIQETVVGKAQGSALGPACRESTWPAAKSFGQTDDFTGGLKAYTFLRVRPLRRRHLNFGRLNGAYFCEHY